MKDRLRALMLSLLLPLGSYADLVVGLAYAEDALVLHLPFDGSLTPAIPRKPVKHGAHNVSFGEGCLGQAVTVEQGGKLWFDIERLFDPHKGTLSLWIRLSKCIAEAEAPYNRIVHIQSAEEGFYYTLLRISAKNNRGLAVNVFGLGSEYEEYSAHGFGYNEAATGWQAGEWRHIALAWHCRRGLCFYDNGQLKFSSWDKEKWVPTTPLALYLDSHPNSAANNAVTFDEVRLYAEALTEAQVKALHRRQDVRVERKPEDFADLEAVAAGWLEKELKDVKNLTTIRLSPSNQARQTAFAKQHLVRAAKIRKVSRREVADGQPRTAVQVAAPLEIEVSGGPITTVEIDGAACNVSLQVLGREVMPLASGKHVRWTLSPAVSSTHVMLMPAASGARISEARFYAIGHVLGVPDAAPKMFYVGSEMAAASLSIRDNPAAGPLYKMPLKVAQASENPETSQGLEGSRVDILTAPMRAGVGVRAIGIEAQFQAPLPSLARMKVTTASESESALFKLDVRFEPVPRALDGTLSLVLDWPDFYLDKGDRLWMTLLFDKATKIAPGAKLILYIAPLETVREEFVTRVLGWFAQWYSGAAEAHPWDSKNWSPAPEIRWLEKVRMADPSNPLATAYYNRIFHTTKDVQVSIPGPEKAPLWARALREALRRTAEVVHWWIDHRQTEDGQFGGGWNDDVELHGWDLLVLGCGDQKVLDALRKLNDGIWSPERFEHGYSNRIWDVEHAAEDSSYSQPRMVALEYGNPKWLERCMETISNFEYWTAINPKGHRHFKSFMFQARKMRTEPEFDSDMADCARAMKPGNYVLWYNGNERLTKLFREWADAWCEDSLKTDRGKPPGILPAEIVFATCELGRGNNKWNEGLRYPLGAITYHTEDELIAVYLGTKDRKYLAPIEAMIREGRAAESTSVTWRRLTGDKKFDERFIAQAAGAAGGANVIAWLATGDKKYLADGCIETVRRYEQTRFLLTEAEPPTDRVSLPGNMLLRQMILGGVAVWVCGWPQMAVSWEEVGYDFAALVLTSAPDRLKVLAYNFGPTRTIRIRTWELQRGTYALRVGADRNHDDLMDASGHENRVEVERGLPIQLALPGDELSVIELALIEAKPLGRAADLALCKEDIRLSEDGKTLTVGVHNIGSLPAKNVKVDVRSGSGEPLSTAVLADVGSPDDLVAKVKPVALSLPPRTPARLRIVVDPENAIPEITKLNNVVEISK